MASILMTSAPRSERIIPPRGPAWNRASSSTRTPSRANPMPCISGHLQPDLEDVVRRNGLVEPLQHERLDLLDLHQRLDGLQDGPGDENLTVLGLGAEARGEVRHAADRRVVEPALEADPSQRREPHRDAAAEAD